MKDKWFSIIFAISMSILAGFSLLMRVESLANVAKAISFPMFLFTLLEVFGHIESSAMQSLELKRSIAKNEEKWMHPYYERAKDSDEDFDIKCVNEYEQLLMYIVHLDLAKKNVGRWIKWYNVLYIFIGVLLTILAILAQENRIIILVSKLNVAAVTLLTFAIFVIEPWVNQLCSDKLEKTAMKKVLEEDSLKKNNV